MAICKRASFFCDSAHIRQRLHFTNIFYMYNTNSCIKWCFSWLNIRYKSPISSSIHKNAHNQLVLWRWNELTDISEANQFFVYLNAVVKINKYQSMFLSFFPSVSLPSLPFFFVISSLHCHDLPTLMWERKCTYMWKYDTIVSLFSTSDAIVNVTSLLKTVVLLNKDRQAVRQNLTL